VCHVTKNHAGASREGASSPINHGVHDLRASVATSIVEVSEAAHVLEAVA